MRFVIFALALLLILLPQGGIAAELSNRANIYKIWADKTGLDGGFNFIIVGDSREGDKTYKAILEKSREYSPLFIVNTGDLVSNGTLKEWDHYKKLIENVEIPMLSVCGNHDVAKGYSNFKNLIGEPNWFFDYGNYRFISIDNARGGFSADTIKFLQKYLQTDKSCFVFFHKPPAVEHWKVHSMNSDGAGGRGGEAMKLMAEAGVKAVFLGHIHLFDDMTIDGIPYVISAGGGAALYKKYKFGKHEHGFVVARVSPEGFSYEWVKVS